MRQSRRPRRNEPGRGQKPPASVLIHGRNAVLEAARAGRVVRVLQASGLGHDPRLEELGKLASIELVAAAELDAIAPGVNQGVAAELKPRREWSLRELLATAPTLLVALDSIMDPQNLGAILRSAEVAGADGAILPEHRSAPLSPSAVKASSGASELMPIAHVSGMPSAVAEVKRGMRFGISFYLIAMLFILFDVEVIFLYPIAVELRAYGSFALVEAIVFIVLLFVAFVYVWRRGALEWR